MKKLLSLVIIAGVFTLTTQKAQAQSSKAEKIINKMTKKLQRSSGVSADFSMKLMPTAKTQGNKSSNRSFTGHLQLKDNNYKVVLKTGQEIISNGKNNWTYLPGPNEVQVTRANTSRLAISPAQLFSGDFLKNYNYTYSGTKTVSGKKVKVITIHPKNGSQKQFSKAFLYVSANGDMPVGADVYNVNRTSKYVYRVSNINTNSHLSSNIFHFDKNAHKGVEVVDLR